MPKPTNNIARNGSPGELVPYAPAPAAATNLATNLYVATNLRVATVELLGNLAQSVDFREFTNQKQYC